MSPEFTFVHCADLHLDSPFEGIESIAPEIASALREATFKAFENVVNLAISERASFLVVAGDVFESENRSLRAQLRFRDAVIAAAESGLQCFIAHGNHDPLSGWEAWLKMPDGVHRFGADLERLAYTSGGEEIAELCGISYPVREVRQNLSRRFNKRPGGPFSIGVLHCNVGGDPGYDDYAPCTIDDLCSAGMDYWALGHMHTRRVFRDEGPCIVQPGNTQGRSVRESGPRGCYVVRVDSDGIPRLDFRETDAVRWFVETADIADLDGPDDLDELLSSIREDVRSRAGGRPAVLRLLLTGRGRMHAYLRRQDAGPSFLARLREHELDRPDFVWTESLRILTQRPIDVEQRRKIEDFPGHFLRHAEQIRADASAVREILDARPERRVIGEQLDSLTDDDLRSIAEEAEMLGLDLLLGEEE